MDKEIIKQLILASIPLISAIISIYIMPILKNFIASKINKDQTEQLKMIFSSLTEFIDKMVKAMEQEHPGWQGKAKKEKVMELTIEYAKSFFGVEMNAQTISFISEVIEGIVKEVKYPNDGLQFVLDTVTKDEGDDLK